MPDFIHWNRLTGRDVRESEVHAALTAAGLVIEQTKAREDWRSLVAGRAKA